MLIGWRPPYPDNQPYGAPTTPAPLCDRTNDRRGSGGNLTGTVTGRRAVKSGDV